MPGDASPVARESVALDASRSQRLANGSLRVPMRMARAGVQDYPDGAHYRSAAALADPAYLESFRGNPITLGHPKTTSPDGLVHTQDWHAKAIGHLDGIPHVVSAAVDAADGEPEAWLEGFGIFTSPAAIDWVESAKRDGKPIQLSCAYRRRAVATSGEYRGRQYQFTVDQCRNDHVAALDGIPARAGRNAVVLDAKDPLMTLEEALAARDAAAAKVLELSGQVASLTAARDAAVADAAKHKAALDSTETKLGTLTAEVSALKAAPVALDAVSELMQLRDDVAVLVDGPYPFGATKPADVRRAIVEQLTPGVSKDQSDAFVTGLFTGEVARRRAQVIVPASLDAAGAPAGISAAKEAYNKRMRGGLTVVA